MQRDKASAWSMDDSINKAQRSELINGGRRAVAAACRHCCLQLNAPREQTLFSPRPLPCLSSYSSLPSLYSLLTGSCLSSR
uniref:Uncharacterized protein n=2 Tax=Arundo donax TaxID=35708 RepID=A0A0A9EFF3_ARUDO